MKGYSHIVIGGGHNGLVAATVLASKGRKVLLLEQRDQLGGLAAAESFHEGYRTAGILNNTSLFRPEVADALGLGSHGLQFESHPSSVFVPSTENSGFMLHGNHSEAAAEIAKISADDGKNYTEFMGFINRIRAVMSSLLVGLPSTVELESGDLWGMIKKGISMRRLGTKDMMEIMRINLMCTADYLNEWFENEHLKSALAMPYHLGTNTGPWSPGTNLNLVLGLCNTGRKVKGGAPAIVEALTAAAKAAGVTIQTGARVANIIVEEGCVSGVRLSDGQVHKARTVMSACHPKHTILDLLGKRCESRPGTRHRTLPLFWHHRCD